MDKNEALNKLFTCAKLYKDNLVNKNLLFIYYNENKQVTYIQTVFEPSMFLHLTGVKFKKGKEIPANQFFKKCLNKRLSKNEFEMAEDGTVELKLKILPMLFCKNLSATMIGEMCENRPLLVTDKLIGGVKGCLGFKFNESGFYVPNTTLNLDIRNSISNKQQIIATYIKIKTDEKYLTQVYKSKNIDLSKIKFPEEFEYLN